jgi:hypothetical protein
MVNNGLRHFAVIPTVLALNVVIGAGQQDLLGLGVLSNIKKPGDIRRNGLPALWALYGCICHKIMSLSNR